MSRHQKRISAPSSWPLERKRFHWTVKPMPGPHPKDRSMPLLMLVRDVLKLADNSREARKILVEGHIIVNGRVRKNYKFPVGIFDVISIPRLNEHYVMLMDRRGILTLIGIDEKDANMKLCKVRGKVVLKGGRIQLNMHDGRNMICDNEFGREVKTLDSLLISLDDGSVVRHLPFKQGSNVIVFGGRHTTRIGRVISREIRRSSEPNIVRIEGLGFCRGLSAESGSEGAVGAFETIEDYVFVIGTDKIEVPGISLA